MSVSEITKIDIHNTFILFWHIKAVVAKNTDQYLFEIRSCMIGIDL